MDDMHKPQNTQYLVNRRNFFKLAAVSLGGLAIYPFRNIFQIDNFPSSSRLGRVNAGKVDIHSRPDIDSPVVASLFEDAVVEWLREAVGNNTFRTNQRWVETPQGYIWSPFLQPVKNQPNTPVQSLPETSLGSGMWVEVSVPYVDLIMDNPPVRSPGFKDRIELGMPLRLYYSQITWVDRVRTDSDGVVWYRINEPYGGYGDVMWADARAFRPITAEEIAPINPEVGNKKVVVNIARQTMACFEGNTEVYFARISSGALWNAAGEKVDAWSTPIGEFAIWRKLISLHMSGGTTGGGWDLPAIGWTTLFVGSGVAVHSTFWHNNFGEPMSRGCVNATPEDARWVFRWTMPHVNLDPGDRTEPWPGGTRVQVNEE